MIELQCCKTFRSLSLEFLMVVCWLILVIGQCKPASASLCVMFSPQENFPVVQKNVSVISSEEFSKIKPPSPKAANQQVPPPPPPPLQLQSADDESNLSRSLPADVSRGGRAEVVTTGAVRRSARGYWKSFRREVQVFRLLMVVPVCG